MYFYRLGGCLSCSFRKTGYYIHIGWPRGGCIKRFPLYWGKCILRWLSIHEWMHSRMLVLWKN